MVSVHGAGSLLQAGAYSIFLESVKPPLSEHEKPGKVEAAARVQRKKTRNGRQRGGEPWINPAE